MHTQIHTHTYKQHLKFSRSSNSQGNQKKNVQLVVFVSCIMCSEFVHDFFLKEKE